MKKFSIWVMRLVGIIGLIWLVLFIKDIPKYRFGYFVEGPKLRYNEYRNTDILKLEDGKILILGSNIDGKYVPSELYDTETNKTKLLFLPNSINYWGKGILLKNNKLLLTHAYSPNNLEYKFKKAYPYDSMAIVNLDTMVIERIIKKEINKTYEPLIFANYSNIVTLNDNKIFIFDNKNRAIEIYDLETNSSKLLTNIPLNMNGYIAIVPTKNNKILLFGENNLSKEKEQNINYGVLDNVYEYDDATSAIKSVGKVMRRWSPIVKKINSNKILIMSGQVYLPAGKVTKVKEIEIYDIDTNSSKIVANINIERCNIIPESSGFNGTNFGKDKFLIIGGLCDIDSLYKATTNSDPTRQSEILDLKTYSIQLGPKTPKKVTGQKMITLDNGNIFISSSRRIGDSKTVQIFKQWRNANNDN